MLRNHLGGSDSLYSDGSDGYSANLYGALLMLEREKLEEGGSYLESVQNPLLHAVPLVDAAEIRKKLPIWAENVENRTASWLSEQFKATKRENKHLDDKLLRRVHKRL